jgi:hypothetical protein
MDLFTLSLRFRCVRLRQQEGTNHARPALLRATQHEF